jgi:hypothetical protein
LGLPEVFARLLRADMSDPGQLVSVWNLENESEVLLAYTSTRTRASGAAQPRDDFAGQTSLVDGFGRVMDQVNLGDVVQRQTAILLRPGEATGFTPIYRELSFAIPALEARLAETGQARVDPFLFRHLAARLDQRMLAGMAASVGRGGPLDPSQGETGALPMTHMNLTVAGLLSPAFATLAQACRRIAAKLAIGVDVMEAAADRAGFETARARIAEAGFSFVLGGVSHLSLLIADPAPWRPDLLKLDWSPRLPDLPEGEAQVISAAMAKIGSERIVLRRADSEAAVHWGLAHGIRRFQGRHVDIMLGAGRMVSCSGAASCTLRQCIERASTIAPAGRAGCSNLALLDQAAPVTKHPATVMQRPNAAEVTA